jgi:DnaJ family protein C protein 9
MIIYLNLLFKIANNPPDKANPETKDEATLKFQEIAFAYAVLSDPVRRKRYDKTGSTAESIDFEDFSWSEFYSEQFRDVITTESIETFSRAYKGSDEEKDDLLNAYEKFKGSWEKIYATVMLSDCLEDEDRFRGIIDAAIERGDVKVHKRYADETAEKREKRMKKARREAEEAEEHAKTTKERMNGKKAGAGMGDLAALIQKRQADRGGFLDHLEAKYKAQEKSSKKGKKGKKRSSDEDEDDEGGMPSEEAFQAAAARLKNGTAESGRKTKRTKH